MSKPAGKCVRGMYLIRQISVEKRRQNVQKRRKTGVPRKKRTDMPRDEGSNVKRVVVDPVTGEVVDYLGAGDSIKKVKNVMRKRNEDRIVAYDSIPFEHFKKLNPDECRAILKELTMAEKAVLFAASLFTSYEDQMLRFTNGKPLNQEHLAEVSGISVRTVSEAIRGLLKKQLLAKHCCMGKRGYQLNPWIAVTGSRIERVMCEKFKGYVVRSCGGKTWHDMEHPQVAEGEDKWPNPLP